MNFRPWNSRHKRQTHSVVLRFVSEKKLRTKLYLSKLFYEVSHPPTCENIRACWQNICLSSSWKLKTESEHGLNCATKTSGASQACTNKLSSSHITYGRLHIRKCFAKTQRKVFTVLLFSLFLEFICSLSTRSPVVVHSSAYLNVGFSCGAFKTFQLSVSEGSEGSWLLSDNSSIDFPREPRKRNFKNNFRMIKSENEARNQWKGLRCWDSDLSR